MEWLFFQSQSDRSAHIRREVFIAPSPHPEIQLWGPCHTLYKCTFPKSVSDAVILCALIEDVFLYVHVFQPVKSKILSLKPLMHGCFHGEDVPLVF